MALEELDSLEILVIIDNEVDPISKYPQQGLTAYGNLADLARDSPFLPKDRGGKTVHEVRMDQICCAAHGLSLMIVGFVFRFFNLSFFRKTCFASRLFKWVYSCFLMTCAIVLTCNIADGGQRGQTQDSTFRHRP